MKTKKTIKIALFLVIIGACSSAFGYFTGGHSSFSIGSNGIVFADENKDLIKSTENLKPFNKLEMDINFADISIIASNLNTIETQSHNKISIEYIGDTLKITQNQKKYREIQVNIGTFTSAHEQIILYVPKDKISSLSIVSNSGDTHIEGITLSTAKIENKFGELFIKDTTSKELTLINNSGDIEITNSIFENKSNINLKFGKIDSDNSIFNNLTLESDSGDTDLVGTFSGNTDITSKFGDVSLYTTKKEADYNYNLSTDFGSIRLNNSKLEKDIITNNNAEHNLTIKNNSGSIDVILGIKD